MKRTLNYLITDTDCGKTVETFLKEKGYSRHILVHLKKTDLGITINGALIYITHRLAVGEILTIFLSEENFSENIVPIPMELSIIYEDEDLMILNKPAGLPVHPSKGHFDNTLANGIAHYFKSQKEAFVFRAVNRLDRDTTGLLIIAKNMISAAILSSMVAKKKIRREYAAIVDGKTETEGTICLPIARKDGSVIERCIDMEDGDYACTHYHRISYHPEFNCSLLLLNLETGRTHQIRVHMKSIGHPLYGDFLYNPDYRYISRQSLHSYRLYFPHPISGEPLSFTAPFPKDFYFLNPFG